MFTVAAKTVSSQEVTSNRPPLTKVNGTGFAVSANGHDGYVLTNNHVVGGCAGNIYGNLPGRTAIKLTIVSHDETNDLALLRASQSFEQTAILSNTPIRPTEVILSAGYPFHGVTSFNFTVAKGVVTSVNGLLKDNRYLQITTPVQPGESGSPLLDMSGHLVGLVFGTASRLKFENPTSESLETVGLAIKSANLRTFLDASKVPYRVADSVGEQTIPEIATAAKFYTMLISCTGVDNAISKE
jgi:S1-C subfamily serine protease